MVGHQFACGVVGYSSKSDPAASKLQYSPFVYEHFETEALCSVGPAFHTRIVLVVASDKIGPERGLELS